MDDLKSSFGIQQHQETFQQMGTSQTWGFNLEGNKLIKNRINGCCKTEQTHFQKKDQNPELKKGCYRKLKIHLSSPLMAENQKRTENASDDSDVHGGHGMINSETCQVCGKIFSSMKSLSGHMRLHPDRKWRGIKPPPASTPQTLSSLTVSVSKMGKIDDQNSTSTSGRSDFGLLQFLKGWSVTGKRGRLSLDEREAAEGLSMLVNGSSLDFPKMSTLGRIRVTEGTLMAEFERNEQVLGILELPKKRKMEGSESGNLEFQCKKPKFDKENADCRDGLRPGFVRLESGLEILDGFQEFLGENRVVDQLGSSCTIYSIPPSRNYIPYNAEIMKQFYELGMMNYIEAPISSDEFKSSMHKAYVDELSLVDMTVRNMTQVDYPQEFSASMLKKQVEKHQCKFCNRTFLTGQALGGHQKGHQRGHWPRQAGAAIRSIPLYGEGFAMDHRLVKIDLRETRLGMVNVLS